MLQRPIAPLVDALRKLGANIEYAGKEGFPPLKIVGCQLHGGEIDIDATISSQFISALLMVAPTMSDPLTIHLKGRAVSVPYVDLTLSMMRRRGINAERTALDVAVMPASIALPPRMIVRAIGALPHTGTKSPLSRPVLSLYRCCAMIPDSPTAARMKYLSVWVLTPPSPTATTTIITSDLRPNWLHRPRCLDVSISICLRPPIWYRPWWLQHACSAFPSALKA